jgi:hypothetical protein
MDWKDREKVREYHRSYKKEWRMEHPGYAPNRDASILRTCFKCKTEKPATAEYFTVEKTRPLGVGSLCKQCASTRSADYARRNRGKVNARQRVWRKNHERRYDLKYRYGISESDYASLLAKQDGRCAICRALPRDDKRGRLAVDHDHKTMSNRGLLCTMCNHALERIELDAEWGAKAVAYLALYKEQLICQPPS